MSICQFSEMSHWDSFYSELNADDVQVFEWYFPYKQCKTELCDAMLCGCNAEDDKVASIQILKETAQILVGGCGNSNLSGDMFSDGFLHIRSMDYSPDCIAQMKKRHSHLPIEYDVQDAIKMTYNDSTFSHFIDKGLLDAVACRDDQEVAVKDMLSEIHRVLVVGGCCLVLSHSPLEARAAYFLPTMWCLGSRALSDGRFLHTATRIGQ